MLRAVPTSPVTPAHQSKAPGDRERDWVSPRGPKASLGSFHVSTIRPNAGPCREGGLMGGLSSTDEHLRGHVTSKSHRLFGSRPSGPRVAHTHSRDDLNTN